jgi:hypothetical protein
MNEGADRDPRRVVEVFLKLRGPAENDFFDTGRVDMKFDHVAPLSPLQGERAQGNVNFNWKDSF